MKKRVALALIATAILLSGCKDNKKDSFESIYTLEEIEIVEESIQIIEKVKELNKNGVKELEKEKESIIENEDVERLNEIIHMDNKYPEGTKLKEFMEKSDEEGRKIIGTEYFFLSLGGIGNKNEMLARALLWSTYTKTPDYDMNYSITHDKVQLMYGNETMEQIYNRSIAYLVSREKYNNLLLEIIKVSLKEDRNKIKPLTSEQKESVKEILDINNANLSVLEKNLKDIEVNRDEIIKNNNFDILKSKFKDIKGAKNTKFAKAMDEKIEEDFSLDRSKLNVNALIGNFETKDFGLEHHRLIMSMYSSISISRYLEGIKEGNISYLGDISLEYDERVEALKSMNKKLKEYNKVLESSLEGKNYLIDNKDFFMEFNAEDVQTDIDME